MSSEKAVASRARVLWNTLGRKFVLTKKDLVDSLEPVLAEYAPIFIEFLIKYTDTRYVKVQNEDGEEYDVHGKVRHLFKLIADEMPFSRLAKLEKRQDVFEAALEPYKVTTEVKPTARRSVIDIFEVKIEDEWVRKAEMADYNYTTKDVARITGLSLNKARTMCSAGVLRARKVGTQWAVTKHDLFDYIVRNMPNNTRIVKEDKIVMPKHDPSEAVVRYILDKEDVEVQDGD